MSRIRGAPVTIKILLIGIVLILLPGAVLSYVSYASVNERARRLEAGYRGALYLVRDKVELEVLRLEQALRSSLGDAATSVHDLGAARHLLGMATTNRPWLRHPFLAGPDGQIVTGSTSFGWPSPSPQSLSWAPSVTDLLSRAEAAEFARKDPAGALEVYEKALRGARLPGERAALLARVGRCRFKLGDVQGGVRSYLELLDLSGSVPAAGDIPTFIVALSQLADGYAAAKDERARVGALLQLHRRLVESPWDGSQTACEYYLKRTGRELDAYAARADHDPSVPDAQTMNALRQSEAERLESMKRFGWIQHALLPDMRSGRNRSALDPSIGHVSATRESTFVSVGYLEVERTAPGPGPWLLGYELDEDQLIGSLLPPVLESADLGGDIHVAVLDQEGKVRFPRTNPVPSAFLATGHFAEVLPSWQLGLFHPDGRSINELVWREKATSLAFLGGTLLVIILGISLTVRAAAHEAAVARLKSDFVSNVSHELKTPLALIRMFGETLESGMVEDEEKRLEFYRIIRAESVRLTHLVNRVLDFSRIEAGVKQYDFREADVVEVIRNTLDTYRLQIGDLGFTIDAQLPAQPVTARIDPDAVSEALLNLLDNATKYSGESRLIGVSVTRDASLVTVSVEDHGVGIPKADLPNVFGKFYRARTEQTRITPGSGLGLALVKHIVEAHRGRVEVESEPGRGSRFSFGLPLQPGARRC